MDTHVCRPFRALSAGVASPGLKAWAWSLDILGGFSGRGTEGGMSQRGASVGKIEEFSSSERMMLRSTGRYITIY